VNRVVSEKEAEQLKGCNARGQPFGEAGWVDFSDEGSYGLMELFI